MSVTHSPLSGFRNTRIHETVGKCVVRLCRQAFKDRGLRVRTKPSKRSHVALAMISILLVGSLSPTIVSATLREGVTLSAEASNQAWTTLGSWLKSKKSAQEPSDRNGVKPNLPETKSQRGDRAAHLEINPKGEPVLQTGQPMLFTAIPVDREGTPIHGLQAEWETSNHLVVAIKKNGQATAGKTGRAILTARVGRLTETIRVTVVEGNGERFGGTKKQDSTRDGRRSQNSRPPGVSGSEAGDSVASKMRHHASSGGVVTTNSENDHASAANILSLALPQRPPNEDALPDSETNSLYQGSNAVGSAPGKTKAAALTPAVATEGTETNGNKNFTFGLPVAGMSGRGLGLSLRLVYNSLVWNKSTDGASNTWMTYDVDSGWPSGGWRLGLGQIEGQGSYGFTLTDPDGTRHALTYSSAYNYDTTDGTFIHYYGGGSWGILSYPDGTVAYYGAGGGGYRLYPTQITDRNGNYILIGYAGTNGAGPKISSIVDTLGRYVHFYYASNGDLVTVTQPGLGTSDLQTMRFYYTDVSIASGLFGSGINVTGPSSIHTLQYVYLPTSSDGSSTHVGYKFEYSPYGMIRQITQSRGMTVTSTSTSSAGSVSAEGTMAARTTYSYPTSASALTDLPTYSTRTDDWAGRTTSMSGGAPFYTFSTNESTGISTVLSPDGTIAETHTIVNSGQWDDGLVSDTYIKDTSTTYAQTHLDWQLDSNSRNPRVYQARNTDSVAGLTKASVLSYTSYNNVSAVSERDFTTNGSVSSTELRRLEKTYVTSSSYTSRYLLNLPATIKVFAGGSSTPSARVDYAYDNYGTSHADMTGRGDIIMHDSTFDPFAPEYEVQGDCIEWDYWQINCLQWNYYWTSDYNPSTDYRGNVTSVTTYPDASSTSGTITHATTYDIAGNVMTAQVDCCHTTSFTYSGAGSSGNHDYASVISITTGNPSGTNLTTSATYDYHTGLVATTTDENSQDRTNYYNSGSLRLEHVTLPGSGATYFTYYDGLSADGAGSYHFYVESATKLDNNGTAGATRYLITRNYFDGRGAPARRMTQRAGDGWSTQDREYDTMGRAYRLSNPYYASEYSYTPLTSSSMFWTTSTFDHLGRLTQMDMPRGDDSNSSLTSVYTSYDGVFTTVTDQAGKVRRQKADALDRVIRLDEPTSSGLGSTTSPNRTTDYYYDTLNNLVKTYQSGDSVTQSRYFKYDSLSRLIRERHVEQDTNSSYDLSDSLTGNSSWSKKFVYNSNGLMTDSYDARGAHTTLSYDDLNRLTQVSYSDSTPTEHYYYDSQTLPSGAPSSSSPDSYARGYATGRLVAMTYGSGATGNYYGYDANGQVTTQFQLTGSTPAKYKLSYAYNYAGLLTSETYPSGRTLDQAYDAAGRLSSLGDGTTTFANSFAYAAHDGLTSETFGNTAVRAMAYNRRLQASQVKLTLGSTVLQQYDYGYGTFNTSSGSVDISKNNGQIGKVQATIGPNAQWNQGFSYDELGRLSNVIEHQADTMSSQTFSQSYTYDRYGNRRQSANSTLGLQAISSSEIDSATNRFISSGTTPTTYDAAGNITRDTKFRQMDYAYDANGRMISAERTDDTGGQTSVYDCAGQRVKTSANNVTRTMVYDIFGQLVADYLGSSGATLQRENIYRGGQLLAVYETGNSCYKSIGDFVDAFYSGVFHRGPTTTERSTAITTLTQAQAQGQGQLIAAAQALGTDLFTRSEYTNTDATQFVTDLYWGYLQRAPDSGGLNFWRDQITVYGSTWANVRHAFEVCTEFQENVASLCTSTSSTSASLKYVLTDAQGSTRAVVNNSGSSSAIVARHDYLPFGEEIWAGIGLRSSSQGYAATNAIRQKYGSTERDDATGLDHSWWRKYESLSGRWTSPDPYNGSMRIGDPQSFNRYVYTLNDPVTLIDPSGLDITFTPPPPSHPHYPNSLFDDYMIDSWRNGWGQIYGLNPISFTFETGHGYIGDGYWWVEYTTFTLGRNSNQQERLEAALKELEKRLNANGGDNPCAKFFGGLANAQQALKGTKFKFKTPGKPDANAQTKGKKVLLNPTGDFFSNSEKVELQVGYSVGMNALTFKSISLDKIQAAAFILAHELGHRTKSFGDNDQDGAGGITGVMNNKAIKEACFPEAVVSP